jgi:hypothetical protein
MNRRKAALVLAAAVIFVCTLPADAGVLRVVVEPDRQVRPDVTIDVWGASTVNGAGNLGDGSTGALGYAWSFGVNANVQVNDDGDLTGTVGNDKFISEPVSFTLLNSSTRELISATLTVGGQPSSNTVVFDIVDASDPISDTPLENLAIDINIAIAEAAEAMVLTQTPDGCWPGYSGSEIGAGTGFAVWALENSGHLPTDDPDLDPFVDWVNDGLAFRG